jgi:hypothetical protein
MAQAAAARIGDTVSTAGLRGPGLGARFMGRLAASAERGRQRKALAGYVGLQAAGRQTGIRG